MGPACTPSAAARRLGHVLQAAALGAALLPSPSAVQTRGAQHTAPSAPLALPTAVSGYSCKAEQAMCGPTCEEVPFNPVTHQAVSHSVPLDSADKSLTPGKQNLQVFFSSAIRAKHYFSCL